MSGPGPLLVAADDRTGALETAAACADAGWSVTVTAGPAAHWSSAHPLDGSCLVVDLATRHLPAALAGARAGEAERWAVAGAGARAAHKIDSTLRGRWATELAGRHAAGRRRIVLVPAFPAAGRTCVGGVVHADGAPVHRGPAGRDARSPVTGSRPAVHLAAAGLRGVRSVADDDALAAWLAADVAGVAVVDAATDADVAALAALVAAEPDVLLAGTAAAVAALALALRAGSTPTAARAAADRVAAGARPGPLPGPVLVVCGSRHPAAVDQVRLLLAAGGAELVETPGGTSLAAALGRGGVVVLRPGGDERTASAVLTDLAADVAAHRAAGTIGTLVVLGGDTAAAVLGAGPLRVEGSAGVGVARCRAVDDDLLVLTRPGGFGGPRALVTLLAGRVAP